MCIDKIQRKFNEMFSVSTFDLAPQVIEIDDIEYELEEERELQVFTSDICDDVRFGYFEFDDAECYHYSVFCKVTVDPDTWEASVSDFHHLEKSTFSIYYEPDRSIDPKWNNEETLL